MLINRYKDTKAQSIIEQSALSLYGIYRLNNTIFLRQTLTRWHNPDVQRACDVFSVGTRWHNVDTCLRAQRKNRVNNQPRASRLLRLNLSFAPTKPIVYSGKTARCRLTNVRSHLTNTRCRLTNVRSHLTNTRSRLTVTWLLPLWLQHARSRT